MQVQLDKAEKEERFAKDRERWLRNQVVELEARVEQLKEDAAQLESHTASYQYKYQSLRPSLSSSSQAEVTPGQRCYSTIDDISYGIDCDALIQNDPVFTDRAASAVPPGLAEIQSRPTAEWQRPGRKRTAGETEAAREMAPAGCNKGEDGAARLKAEHSLVQSANMRAVPKIVL